MIRRDALRRRDSARTLDLWQNAHAAPGKPGCGAQNDGRCVREQWQKAPSRKLRVDVDVSSTSPARSSTQGPTEAEGVLAPGRRSPQGSGRGGPRQCIGSTSSMAFALSTPAANGSRWSCTCCSSATGRTTPSYEAVLDRLTPDQAPMAMFTAHREGARRYAAVVEGLPPDWSIPQTGQTTRPPLA